MIHQLKHSHSGKAKAKRVLDLAEKSEITNNDAPFHFGSNAPFVFYWFSLQKPTLLCSSTSRNQVMQR